MGGIRGPPPTVGPSPPEHRRTRHPCRDRSSACVPGLASDRCPRRGRTDGPVGDRRGRTDRGARRRGPGVASCRGRRDGDPRRVLVRVPRRRPRYAPHPRGGDDQGERTPTRGREPEQPRARRRARRGTRPSMAHGVGGRGIRRWLAARRAGDRPRARDGRGRARGRAVSRVVRRRARSRHLAPADRRDDHPRRGADCTRPDRGAARSWCCAARTSPRSTLADRVSREAAATRDRLSANPAAVRHGRAQPHVAPPS